MRPTSLLIACTLAAPAVAQAEAQAQDDPLARFSFSLRTEASYVATADLDGAGEVGVARVGPTLGIRYAEDQSWALDVGLGAEYSFYDFSGATGIVAGGDPAGDFAEYSLSARYSARANDQWWWFVGGRASWAGEESENLGDGFTGGGTVGATYAVNDQLTVGLGVAVRSRIEDDALVFPLPIINWEINDQWTLATAESGLRLSYAPFEDWTFFAAGGWESREFRLLDTGPIPGGVMRDDRVPVVAGAVWEPNSHIAIEASVGMSMLNSYEFLDAAGNELVDPDSDGALMAGLSARIRF